MKLHFGISAVPVAAAKAKLPELLEDARRHHPQLISRHGRDLVAVVALEDLCEALREHRFETEVEVSAGEATVTLPQFELIGIGETVDVATEDALQKLQDYAVRYLRRFEFYRETNRRDLYPLVLRFLLTPKEQQLELLFEDEPSESAAATA